jgi:hypothetical protein
MSIVDVANGRLLESGFERLVRMYRDLVRKAQERRIACEAANDISLLSG